MFSLAEVIMTNGFFINYPFSTSLSHRKSIQLYSRDCNTFGTEFDLDISDDEKSGRCDIEDIITNTSILIDNNNHGNQTAIATTKYYKNLRMYNMLTRLISNLVIERSYIEDEMTTLDLENDLDLDINSFFKTLF